LIIFDSLNQLVFGSLGWQTYCVVNPEATQEMCGNQVKIVEELPKHLEMTVNSTSLPKSACLGIFLKLAHLTENKAT